MLSRAELSKRRYGRVLRLDHRDFGFVTPDKPISAGVQHLYFQNKHGRYRPGQEVSFELGYNNIGLMATRLAPVVHSPSSSPRASPGRPRRSPSPLPVLLPQHRRNASPPASSPPASSSRSSRSSPPRPPQRPQSPLRSRPPTPQTSDLRAELVLANFDTPLIENALEAASRLDDLLVATPEEINENILKSNVKVLTASRFRRWLAGLQAEKEKAAKRPRHGLGPDDEASISEVKDPTLPPAAASSPSSLL